MSDLEQIFCLLAAFYLAECAYWVRPGSVVFVSRFGGRHRMRSLAGGAVLRNDRGGAVMGHLLPFGDSAACQAWPLSLSPQGVYSYVSAAIPPETRSEQPARWVAFDELKSVAADGRRIEINGTPFLKVNSVNHAGILARLIRKLTDTPEAERAAVIDAAIAKSLNAAEAEERHRAALDKTAFLQTACTVLFAFTFGCLGAAGFFLVPVTLQQAAVSYAGLLALTILLYLIAHRSLRPTESAERHKEAAIMLVSPANAMHARDGIFRSLFEIYHPLAMAAALCKPAEFAAFAARAVRDLRHPLPPPEPSDGPAAQAAEAWFRERLNTAVLSLLRSRGIDPDKIPAPAPETSDCRSHCPRCEAQYELTTGLCADCRLELRPFESAPASPTAVSDPRLPQADCPPVSVVAGPTVDPGASALASAVLPPRETAPTSSLSPVSSVSSSPTGSSAPALAAAARPKNRKRNRARRRR